MGNSDVDDWIDLINKYLDLFGKESIDCLLADREFVVVLNGSNFRIRLGNLATVFLEI